METGSGDRAIDLFSTPEVPEEYQLDRDIHEVAARIGLRAVPADDRMIQVDWDAPEWAPNDAQSAAQYLLDQHFGISSVLITTSKSGNRHIYFFLDTPMDLASRVAFQAALGSDPKREALGVLRIQKLIASPVAFFETEDEYQRVQKRIQELRPDETPF